MRKVQVTLCLFLLFHLAAAASVQYAWTETFSDGLNGWINTTQGAWAADTGKLTYTGNTDPAYNKQFLYDPHNYALSEGFRLRAEYGAFPRWMHDGAFGLVFGFGDSVPPLFRFLINDVQGEVVYYDFSYWTQSGLYMYYGYSVHDTSMPFSMEVVFDGDCLDLYVQNQIVRSDVFGQSSWTHRIQDGHIGLMYQDFGIADEQIIVNSISFVPEPASLVLMSLGGLLLRKRK